MAADFYGGLFGWEFEETMPPDLGGNYLIARCETKGWSLFDRSGAARSGQVAAMASLPDGAPPAAMWNTYVWVESADETTSKVRDVGGAVAVEPYDVPGAGRMAVFTDPEGAAFRVLQAREHKGAEVVNDPGALNFNGPQHA